MARMQHLRTPAGWKKGVAAAAGLALISGVFVAKAGPGSVSASSHREAPLIAGDPRADNTDVYAFTSPDKTDSVTLISNWIPFEEPNGGPNFYPFADDTQYNIKIDNNGDGVADLTYTWVFTTHIKDPNQQFLTNTGQVKSLTDPTLNQYQTYDLTLTPKVGAPVLLVHDAIAAPSIAGAASMPDYTPLRDQAIVNLPGNIGKTFVGQADDPFFADLRVFDLLYGANASEVGTDTLAGYNVNSIALQVPKNLLAINGDATRNPVIGVWSTTDRRAARVASGAPSGDSGAFTQVSRLGNPLVNEVVVPLALKDAFNSISPDQDHTVAAVVDKVQDPILAKLLKAIYGVNVPPAPRNDLSEIFLQGISKANAGVGPGDPATVLPVDLNSQDLNADARTSRGNVDATPSEMLRLNMSVPVAAQPNRLGVLAGDVQGFPNGRRLTDDVLDIEVQAVAGATVTGKLVAGLATVDSVDRNDHAFGSTFPYLALPNVRNVNTGVARAPRAPEYIALNPQRVLETRTSGDGVNGQLGYSGAKPAAGQTIKVKVTGLVGSLVPSNAKAVYLNVTAVNSDNNGYVTAYACGAAQPLASSFNPVPGLITTNLVAAPLAADGTVCLYTNVATDLAADIEGYHPADAAFIPTQPERLLETRTTEIGSPQKGYTGAKPGDGSTVTLHVTGTGNAKLAADTKAVYLNVTATNSSGAGYVTVFPCGTQPPNTSNVNLVPGLDRATLVVAKVGTNGNVCLYSSRSTDLVADLEGYAPASSPYVPAVPERLLETRAQYGQIGYSGDKPIRGQTIELKVTGVGATQVPATAGAVILNVTLTENSAGGYVTVYPCGSPRPLASNLNLTGLDTPNMVAAKVGDGGRVCIFTTGPTHIVADIFGYFPDPAIVG